MFPSSLATIVGAAAAIDLLHLLADPGRRAEVGAHLAPGGKGEILFRVDIEGIGGRDLQHGVGEPQRQDVEPADQWLRHGIPDRAIEVAEIGDGKAEPGGGRAQHIVVAGELPRDDEEPQRLGLARGLEAQRRDHFGRQHLLHSGNQPLVGELHATSCMGSV